MQMLENIYKQEICDHLKIVFPHVFKTVFLQTNMPYSGIDYLPDNNNNNTFIIREKYLGNPYKDKCSHDEIYREKFINYLNEYIANSFHFTRDNIKIEYRKKSL